MLCKKKWCFIDVDNHCNWSNRQRIKISATDVMIDHELLWMLFLGSSDRNIRNTMRALLRNMTNKQNKLNSANSPNSILAFLLCQYIHYAIIVHLWNYLQRMLWLTMNCYGCCFFRAVIVTSITKMLGLLRKAKNEQNKLNNATSLDCILTFLLCQYIVIEVIFFLYNYM